MQKALASVVIIAFAGLLGTSLMTLFSGQSLTSMYLHQQSLHVPYFMAY